MPKIPVTPELLHKRHNLLSKLQHIYKTQIELLEETGSNDKLSQIGVINHYLSLKPQYLSQLKDIQSSSFSKDDQTNNEISEEEFIKNINKQLDSKVSELEIINNLITSKDLKQLDNDYTNEIDNFFNKFHKFRIAASFSLKEYINPSRLLTSFPVNDIINQGIETTSRMLSLNDYPIPKFTNKINGNNDLKIYCVSPHIVHIMFELFKNATIPSISNSKPIIIDSYLDSNDLNTIILEIKDNGGGMPSDSDIIEKIWHFHYTTTKANERDPIHGFGMGLPLCKVFAEFNDGKLELINKEGDGITVLLRLPKATK